MVQIFNSFLTIISSLMSFLIHTITSLVSLIAHVPVYVSFLVASINVLPAIVIPFALASISLGAVLFMLGR